MARKKSLPAYFNSSAFLRVDRKCVVFCSTNEELLHSLPRHLADCDLNNSHNWHEYMPEVEQLKCKLARNVLLSYLSVHSWIVLEDVYALANLWDFNLHYGKKKWRKEHFHVETS